MNEFVSILQNILLSFTNIFITFLLLNNLVTFMLFFNIKKEIKLKNPIYILEKQLYDRFKSIIQSTMFTDKLEKF